MHSSGGTSYILNNLVLETASMKKKQQNIVVDFKMNRILKYLKPSSLVKGQLRSNFFHSLLFNTFKLSISVLGR